GAYRACRTQCRCVADQGWLNALLRIGLYVTMCPRLLWCADGVGITRVSDLVQALNPGKHRFAEVFDDCDVGFDILVVDDRHPGDERAGSKRELKPLQRFFGLDLGAGGMRQLRLVPDLRR